MGKRDRIAVAKEEEVEEEAKFGCIEAFQQYKNTVLKGSKNLWAIGSDKNK